MSAMDPEIYKQLLNDDDVTKTNETLVFNPYNPLNKEIKLSDVQGILTNYGLPGKVFNLELYQRAFVHRSYTKRPHLENLENGIIVVDRPHDCMPLKTKSNERQNSLETESSNLSPSTYCIKGFLKKMRGL